MLRELYQFGFTCFLASIHANQDMFFPRWGMKSWNPIFWNHAIICNLIFLGFGTLKILLMDRILSCLLTPSKHIKARVPFVSVAGKCLSLHEMPPLTLLENHQSNTSIIYNCNCFVFVKIQLDLGTKRPSANCAIPGGISVSTWCGTPKDL